DLALGGRPATRSAAARAASGARRAGLAAAGVAAVLVIAHAAVSDALIERRLRLRMEGVDLALDPALARMEIARRAARGVREAVDDRPARIAILAPAAGRTWYSATTGAPTSTPDSAASHYDLYPAALDGGRALRALFPNVDSVAFVTRWSPAWRGFDLLMSDPDGTTRVFGRGATAYRRVGAVLINNGLPREAAEFLAVAVGEFPDDPALRWEYGLALARFGAREAALEQLRELIRRAPGDSLAARARAVLEAARPTPQPEGPRGR
ncbi:MAG TPA: tetratricopeptide repeat protein, partial [Candidatus Eisenbacteria bacterium]